MFDKDYLEKLCSPGPRLPIISDYLLSKIWTLDNLNEKGPASYLNDGESIVNKFEDLISISAPRIYDELVDNPVRDKSILDFLSENEKTAVVVFDGLSIREIPVLLQLSEKAQYSITENTFSLSAVPSETMDFIERKLNCGKVPPSSLPTNRKLKDMNIDFYYYSQVTERQTVRENGNNIILWSSFPDKCYMDSTAKNNDLFEIIIKQLETVFQNTVQQLTGKRKILLTSDHGYVFFGVGSCMRSSHEMNPLNSFFGNNRSKDDIYNDNPILQHPDVYYYEKNKSAVVRSRIKTKSRGQAATKLYKHGGLSLMECLVPWIIIEKE